MKRPLRRLMREITDRWGPDHLDRVTFALTYRCNLACKTCGSWVKGRDPHLKELDAASVIEVIEQLPDLGVQDVFLVGSEVLLFEGFLDVLRGARRRGLRCSFLTNASLVTEQIANEAMSAHPTQITVSIDGEQATHDRLRGDKSFARAMTGLEHLSKARRERSPETDLGVHMTLSRFNAGSLRAALDLSRDRGWDFSVQAASFTTARHIENSTINGQPAATNRFLPRADYSLRKQDLDLLAQTHRELMQEGRFIAGLHLITNLPEKKLIRGEYPLGPCVTIRHNLLIEPDGRVVTCANLDAYAIGNVHTQSVAEIWNSPRRRELARMLGKNGPPVCLSCCNYTQNISVNTLARASVDYLRKRLAERPRHPVPASSASP